MSCEHCTDGSGGTVYPYYGVAPHVCFYKIPGATIGQSRLLPQSEWPANYAPDEDEPGCGTYTHCLECGAGDVPSDQSSGEQREGNG